MADTVDRTSSRPISAAWIAALALLVALMAFYRPQAVCVPAPTPAAAVAEQEDPAAIEAAVQTWQAMWDKIETEGVDALDPGVNVAGAQYAGDTCGMRYRRLYRGVSRETRERMVIAAFSNEPRIKRQVLEPLLASPEPGIKARAAVELARVALRQKDADRADAALDEAAGLVLPPACEADVHYFRGRVALHRGDMHAAYEALAAATERDRGFWNAWRDQIPLLVRTLHESPQRTAECLERTRRLIEVLGLLPQLANDVGQFGKLALMLDRMGAHSSATLFASALMWQWAGQEVHGRSVLKRAMDAPAMLPAACEREVRARIADRLGDA